MAKIPSVRIKYEEKTGKIALTKAGSKTKDYQEFLLKNCTPVWSSVWSKAYKRNTDNPYKSGADIKKDLENFSKEARMAEKCVVGGKGFGTNFKAISSFRTESKEKYNISNY